VTSTSTREPGTIDPVRWPDVAVAAGSPGRATVARVLFGTAIVRLPVRSSCPTEACTVPGDRPPRSCTCTGPASSSAGSAPPA
jgi:hypothetical protein